MKEREKNQRPRNSRERERNRLRQIDERDREREREIVLLNTETESSLPMHARMSQRCFEWCGQLERDDFKSLLRCRGRPLKRSFRF